MVKGLKKKLKKSVSKGFRPARFCPTSASYICFIQALYTTVLYKRFILPILTFVLDIGHLPAEGELNIS